MKDYLIYLKQLVDSPKPKNIFSGLRELIELSISAEKSFIIS